MNLVNGEISWIFLNNTLRAYCPKLDLTYYIDSFYSSKKVESKLTVHSKTQIKLVVTYAYLSEAVAFANKDYQKRVSKC